MGMLGIAGTGRMARVLATRLVAAGAVPAADLLLWNRTRATAEALAQSLAGAQVAASLQDLACRSAVILLGTHPTGVEPVLAQLAPHLRGDHLLVSLAGTYEVADLEARVPCRVLKVVPSVTHGQGAGAALVVRGTTAAEEDLARVRRWLAHVGAVAEVPESEVRTAADLTSVAPALWCALARALRDAAARAGLPVSLAAELVSHGLTGTGALLAAGMRPEDVIAQVALPGGITEAALEVLAPCAQEMWERVLRTTRATYEEHRRALGLPTRPRP